MEFEIVNKVQYKYVYMNISNIHLYISVFLKHFFYTKIVTHVHFWGGQGVMAFYIFTFITSSMKKF